LLTKLHVLNMKKLIYTFTMLAFGLHSFAQQKTNVCGTDEHYKQLKSSNPKLKLQEDKSSHDWKNFIQNYNPNDYKTVKGLGKASAPKYIIPVVVHVIHGGTSNSENITDAQVKSEIDFLNKSFRNLNSDTGKRREIFKDIAADMEVEFRFAKKDPNGKCTNGIVRHYSTNADKGDDILKRESVWNTKHYLNMWVVRSINKGGGLGVAGYAQFPFAGGVLSSGTDGVMMIHNEFGNIGTSSAGQTPNVTTTTHEVGHWLGLFHPFQDSDTCDAEGDGVYDTPRTFFRPTNAYPLRNECGNASYNSCGGKDYRYIKDGESAFSGPFDLTKFGEPLEMPDLQEAFMDYFIGNCASNMFTLQQKARVHFCINTYRPDLCTQENLVRTGVNDPTNTCNAIPSFYSTNKNICAGGTVTFTHNLYNGTATAYNWTFNGGTPLNATTAAPGTITYNAPGTYDVKLSITTNGNTVDTIYKNYITVVENSAPTANLNYADWQYANDWFQKGWRFESENGKAKWNRTIGVSYNGIASMKLEDDPGNSVPSHGFEQSLISPSFNLTGATLPTFRFAYSTALVTGPGTAKSTDELRVYQSTNCGTSWTQMSGTGAAYIGTAISTTGLTLIDFTTGFVPSDKSKWREVSLTAPTAANVRFKITLTRRGGSNFYLDAVRVASSGALGLVNELEKSIKFNVSPNPFNSNTELSYELSNASDVNIVALDILGRNIGTLLSGKSNAGNHIVNLDRNVLGLNNGIYFVKVEIGNQSFVRKIMVN
jgi:PKD repeat protein